MSNKMNVVVESNDSLNDIGQSQPFGVTFCNKRANFS